MNKYQLRAEREEIVRELKSEQLNWLYKRVRKMKEYKEILTLLPSENDISCWKWQLSVTLVTSTRLVDENKNPYTVKQYLDHLRSCLKEDLAYFQERYSR